jgi:hypothetical protein
LTTPLRSLSSLHLLLIYQPHLEYLNVHIGGAKTSYDYTITPFRPLSNLREFHFRSDDFSIKFDNLLELLTYFPNLKSLSLDLTTTCRLFFDGDILQTLVYSLDSFQFSIARFSQPTPEEQTLSTFYTSFWLETKQWYTQSYWHIDEDNLDSDYFHIYSIPFPFSNFDVYKCTNENIVSKDKFQPFSKVKRLDLSETSDINIIPFVKRCPNVNTIYLNHIFDDEENYGTDDEEDITDQTIHSDDDLKSINSYQLSLPRLSHVHYLILHALPEHDLEFFHRLIHATPNLYRLSVYSDDLMFIIHTRHDEICQILQKMIYQLEIHLDYSWSLADIRRNIPKILRIFSNIKSITISFDSTQKRSSITAEQLLTNLLEQETNLMCINLESESSTGFENVLKQGGIELIKRWLISSNNNRFKSNDNLKNSVYIELNFSSMIIWL